MLAAVFAGDDRVWRTAALAGVPLVALTAFYCLRPRDYYTGTDNVEAYTYILETPAGEPVCVRGLQIPADTARIRLQLISRTRLRPALKMALTFDGSPSTIDSTLGPITVPANRISAAVFAIPALAGHATERRASLCLTAAEVVNWGGTPLQTVPSSVPPTMGGRPIAGRVAVWYLPRAGAQRSYLARAGAIMRRASLFRPGLVGPWLYVVILLVVLPGLALASVRCLALAATAGRLGIGRRRLGAWLFAIAALNFACWALITPPFQAPDEVDHFAYTQSLVERGEAPSRVPGLPLARWSSAEALVLDDMSFTTDHQEGDTRPPWTAGQQATYRAHAATLRPSAADGGGVETAATHGAIYYAMLAPAYMLASGSPIDQLTLMRLASALIGALTVLFAFLLVRELAPGRAWLAVLAALLIAYQPMYGFISGAVNNDVGVNAGAAALQLLLILMLRRGVTLRLGLMTGGLLVVLPIVKGTAYAIYPVAGIALLATLWRHHRRTDLAGWSALGARCSRDPRVLGAYRGSFSPLGRGSRASTRRSRLGHELDKRSAHPSGWLPRLLVAGVPAAPVVHDAALRDDRLTGVYDLRGTRLGCLRLVRRVLSPLGVRGDTCGHARRSTAGRAGRSARVGLRAPQSLGGDDTAAHADRGGGGLRGGFLYDWRAAVHPRIRALRVPRDRPARSAGRRQPARLWPTLDVVCGRRAARRNARAQLRLAAVDPDRLLCLSAACA